MRFFKNLGYITLGPRYPDLKFLFAGYTHKSAPGVTEMSFYVPNAQNRVVYVPQVKSLLKLPYSRDSGHLAVQQAA